MVRRGLSLLVVGVALARETRVVMESAPRAEGWEVVRSLEETTEKQEAKLELYFMVKHQNVEKLFSEVKRVSDPRSGDYGKHLKLQEVDALVAPREEDVQRVVAFLTGEAAAPDVEVTNGGSIVAATVSVATAERLLGATYATLRHRRTGKTARRILSNYSLPFEVADVVDFVAPTVHVPAAGKALTLMDAEKDAEEDAEATISNTPASLKELYGIDAYGKSEENSLAVTAFLEQYYSKQDLKLYWTTYCNAETGVICGDGSWPTVVGDATIGEPAGVESMLDIETVTGIAGGVHTEFWGFSGRSPDNAENEPFMAWLKYLGATVNAPLVFSTSYGEDESSWSEAAADRLNEEFAKVAARGISLLFASGDEGANCEGTVFAPETPASSPYVTAVGGTSGRPEAAVGLSSGGFSNYWGQPDYQADLVDAYLANSANLPPSTISFNASGRAVPDVSGQAANFCVTPFGCTIAGTSCSSPLTAAIVSLLNDLRLLNGKPALGFLNYFIYQNYAAFNDITTGVSAGCGRTGAAGWPAAPGWDAVTGVGTPNFSNLRDIVLALP